MRVDIITIFPEMVEKPLSYSLIGKGREKGLFEINIHNLRDYAYDKHKVVDDIPYGGGPGMVMKPEPIFEALSKIDPDNNSKRLITSASGTLFNQNKAVELSVCEWITIVCGHYKGVDQRVIELAGLEEISIGDYVLTGGEYAATVICDAVLRLIPGTMKDFGSALEDSHQYGMLGAEEYTRPEIFKGVKVPEVLLSGHHEKIKQWRLANSLHRTKVKRPDLFSEKDLTNEEKNILNRYELTINDTETDNVRDQIA